MDDLASEALGAPFFLDQGAFKQMKVLLEGWASPSPSRIFPYLLDHLG